MKRTALPFLARPPEVDSYKGIRTYPGFHTTSDYTVAALYALGKIINLIEEDENGVNHVSDYPVVVALDMSSFEKDVDYDAVEMVMETLKYEFQAVLEHVDDISNDDEILDAMRTEVDNSSAEMEIQNNILNTLSEETFSHFKTPLAQVYDHPRILEAIREFAQYNEVPKDILMEATKQYRYLEDINEDRIRAIWFVTPVAEEQANYQDDDYNEAVLQAKWPGFDILSDDEVLGGRYNPAMTLVYGQDGEANVEYHGTTYTRLVQAAPEIAGKISPPPSPPYLPT